ncbi:MAG: DUF1566 domain-containing protein [Magnetococcales bacterium]|nr:DUF1566 domain-containing protein [Magnetococcales bacterium]
MSHACCHARGSKGFTLIEVMAGMVLLSILWLGMLGVLRHVEQNRQDLLLKQKVVFALDTEMKRLYYLYNRGNLWSEKVTHADNTTTGEGRWIYRATPAAASCPNGKPNCFLHTSVPTYANFLQGELIFRDLIGSVNDTNLFWVDREARIVGKLSWILSGTNLDTCCRKITLSMTWPYRFQEGGDPAAEMGPTQTMTLEGIVGVVIPTQTVCVTPTPVYPAPVAKTGQTTSYTTGDDGTNRTGVAWPTPRFTDNGNGTVTDNLTGLIWLKHANCFGWRIWTTALNDANNLASGSCGLSDGSVAGNWRLPSIRELNSLIDISRSTPALPSGHPFISVASSYSYWSSTTNTGDTSLALGISISSGILSSFNKTGNTLFVLTVRGGQ